MSTTNDPLPTERFCSCVGNRALLSLLRQGRIQTKARVTKPDDPREVEADRVADSVLRMEEPSSEEVAPVEEAPLESTSTSLGEVLRSPGEPLDTRARDFFEPRFQRSFDGVRVHTNSEASALGA